MRPERWVVNRMTAETSPAAHATTEPLLTPELRTRLMGIGLAAQGVVPGGVSSVMEGQPLDETFAPFFVGKPF